MSKPTFSADRERDEALESDHKLMDEIQECRGQLADQNFVIDKLRKALLECEEYLDDRADAEQFTHTPGWKPNEEMRLLNVVREALK